MELKAKYYYKLENEDGTSLTGFETMEEAMEVSKHLREDKKWSIISYYPEVYELNLCK